MHSTSSSVHTSSSRGAAYLTSAQRSLAGEAVRARTLADGACLRFTADSDEGNLVVGASAVHAAALELIVRGGELTEVADWTVLRSGSAYFRRSG